MIEIKKRSLYRLKTVWNKLYNNNHTASPFQDYEFAKILIRTYRYYPYFSDRPKFYVFYENNLPIMIAPLIKHYGRSGIFFKSLGARFRVAYEDFIYDDTMTKEKLQNCIDLLLKKLKRRIDVEFVSEDSILFSSLKDKYQEYRKELCVDIMLPKTYQEFRKICLTKNTRETLNTKYNRLNREKWEVKIFQENKMTRAKYKKFLDVYLTRYDQRWNPYTDKLKRAYYSWFTRYKHHNSLALNKLGSAITAELIINGEVASIIGGYVQKDENYIVVHRLAMLDKFSYYSPGKVLLCEFAKKMMNDYHIYRFDLSKGGESYKYTVGGKDYYQHCFRLI